MNRLPANAPHPTAPDKTNAEVDAFFDTLSEKEIRRRQDLCRQQQRMAYDQKNERAAENLAVMDDDLMNAMLRRC